MSSTADFRNLTPLVLMSALQAGRHRRCTSRCSLPAEAPADTLESVLPRAGSAATPCRTPRCAVPRAWWRARFRRPGARARSSNCRALTGGEGVLEHAFERHRPVCGAAPTRPRSDHNPLNRKEYMLHVARPGRVPFLDLRSLSLASASTSARAARFTVRHHSNAKAYVRRAPSAERKGRMRSTIGAALIVLLAALVVAGTAGAKQSRRAARSTSTSQPTSTTRTRRSAISRPVGSSSTRRVSSSSTIRTRTDLARASSFPRPRRGSRRSPKTARRTTSPSTPASRSSRTVSR